MILIGKGTVVTRDGLSFPKVESSCFYITTYKKQEFSHWIPAHSRRGITYCEVNIK